MDTLYTIHVIALDADFAGRLAACVAQEGYEYDPVNWVWERRYAIAAAPGWAAAVDYWIAANPDADPSNGWAIDQAVISDGMITAQIQTMLGAI